MKQPNPQRWAEYMHECAERCRRQLAAAQVRAGIRRVTYAPVLSYYGDSRPEITGAVELPGRERPRDWFEDAIRRGCTDEAG